MNFLNTVAKNYEYFDKFKILIFKWWRVFMWQLYTLLYMTGVRFRGKLQHGGDASQQKICKKLVPTKQNLSNRSGLIVRCTVYMYLS